MSEDTEKQPETRRTRLKAGDDLSLNGNNVDKQDSIYTITHKGFLHGLTFYDSKEGDSHLVALPNSDGTLHYNDGILYFKNIPFSKAKLMEMSNNGKTEIENFDLPLLTVLYSIILEELADKNENMETVSELDTRVKIFMPDLARKIGRKSKLNKKSTDAIVRDIASFNSIVGILNEKSDDGSRTYESILPVLLFLGYEEKTNTIEFTSPYMTKLIETIYKASIKRDAQGAIKYRQNGIVELNPSHSTLIKTSIANERNKVAVEIVMEVVKLIERAGNTTPNIKAITLIERVPQLAIRLNKIDASDAKNPRSNKNTALKRAFSKAWELLDTQTYLKDRYLDIKLPDPKDPANIPRLESLNMVFTFPHKGKVKEKQI